MGKVAKEVEKRQKEAHITTEKYIDLLHWYIKESEKLRRECVEAQGMLNEAFNSRIKEIKDGNVLQ